LADVLCTGIALFIRSLQHLTTDIVFLDPAVLKGGSAKSFPLLEKALATQNEPCVTLKWRKKPRF